MKQPCKKPDMVVGELGVRHEPGETESIQEKAVRLGFSPQEIAALVRLYEQALEESPGKE
ncbi:MAG: hypothetical protein AAF478_01260 [Pseudomonadota bacterium]